MAKDKKTQRSSKTLPNDWTSSGKRARDKNRRKGVPCRGVRGTDLKACDGHYRASEGHMTW